MSYKRILSCLAFAACVSAPAFAQDTVEPELPVIQLRGVTFNGTGCRVSPDQFPELNVEGNTLKFYAPPFVTQIGPGLPIMENRKNCIMALDIAVPAGWSYALDSFELRGYMDLDAGIKGEVTQMHYFEGLGQSGKWTASWTGPKHSDVALKDKIGLESKQWSPCGVERRLVLNTALRLSKVNSQTSPNAFGYFQLDDAMYMQQLGFTWRKC